VEEAFGQVVRTLEREILPRLVLVHRGEARPRVSRAVEESPPTATEVGDFVQLLMAHDSGVAYAFVDAMRLRGVAPHAICLKLLAPAASRLGQMWEQDSCSFMQVTMGLCRLHRVLHRLGNETGAQLAATDGSPRRCVLLAGLPGDQHTFGVLVAGQIMRRAGWDVWNEFPASLDDLMELVERNAFQIIGLSVGSDRELNDVPGMIRGIRRGSRYRKASVVLGGPMLSLNPALAAGMGADTAPVDGDDIHRWARVQLGGTAAGVRRG
jgi:methanogenic corrinoid protein MtbC1